MRIWRRESGVPLACLAAVVAALAVPASAAARPGGLDRGFSGDGKLVTYLPPSEGESRSIDYQLPFEFAPGRIATAQGPGGKIAVANNRAIVVYLSNGRRDRRFGGGGAVPLGSLPEGYSFRLADVAVDSKGRVLVAGTTESDEQVGLPDFVLPGPIPSGVTISRYLPSGQPDPSFGFGGVAYANRYAPWPDFQGRHYSAKAVSATGLAVDAEDQPILTGSAVVEVGYCPNSLERFEASRPYVIRLSDGGDVGPPLDGGTTLRSSGIAWLALPRPTAAGFLLVGGVPDPCSELDAPYEPSVLTSFTGGGQLNRGFAADGLWSRPFLSISDVATAPKGRIVLLTRTAELRGGKWVQSTGKVLRLRANGSIDRRFGKRGVAAMKLPRRASIAAIATDARGRVLLAGTVKRKPRRGKRAHLEILLARATTAGKADRRFGRRGRIATGFGARANVRTADAIAGRHRITVGGKLSGPAGGNAFAIARYRGGR